MPLGGDSCTGLDAPYVAMGLPVYNAEKYLRAALDSILAQTFTDFELIISDNASTDSTPDICRAYAARDRRIRYHRNETNLGAAPNFNRAFELASSKYFKWVPYDDALCPEFLARCVDVLDNNPDVVVCYTRARIIDEQGVRVCDHDPGPDTSSSSPAERFRNLILHPEYCLQLLGLIRADVLKSTALHGRFPSSDEVLLAELALRGRFFQIPERLYIYRRHAGQSTSEPKQRLRVGFFDTSLKGKIVLPKWVYFFACLDVVRRARLGWRERVRCYGHIGQWVVVPAHLRALAKDVLLALKQLLAKPFALSRSSGKGLEA